MFRFPVLTVKYSMIHKYLIIYRSHLLYKNEVKDIHWKCYVCLFLIIECHMLTRVRRLSTCRRCKTSQSSHAFLNSVFHVFYLTVPPICSSTLLSRIFSSSHTLFNIMYSIGNWLSANPFTSLPCLDRERPRCSFLILDEMKWIWLTLLKLYCGTHLIYHFYLQTPEANSHWYFLISWAFQLSVNFFYHLRTICKPGNQHDTEWDIHTESCKDNKYDFKNTIDKLVN